MRILFVCGQLGYIDPVAVAFLSAVAKQRGHQCSFCSLDTHDFDEIYDLYQPEVLAFSAFSSDIDDFEKVNKRAKEKSEVISIIGGPHPTFAVQDTLKRGFDACVIGEGELTFGEFLDRVDQNKSFDDVSGIVTAKQTVPKIRPLIADIDTLPFPDRDLVLGSTILANTSKKTFFTSRGCPYQCTYCLNPALQKLYRGKGKFIRRFSVDRVIEEILYIKKRYTLDYVKFDDDVFAIKADSWLEEFADKYVKKVALPFNCLVRLDHAKDDLLKLLKKAGCHSITTSIDCASDKIRREVLNRKMDNEAMIETLRSIDDYKIETFVNFILDLPGASIEDDLQSIEMARQSRVTYTNYTFITLFPGTKIRKYCIEKGVIDENYELPSLMSDVPTLSKDPDDIRIRKNIMDLGHIAAISDEGIYRALLNTIKQSPNVEAFGQLKRDVLRYNMENVIYKCSDEVDL